MKHKKLVLVVPVFPQISETFIVSKFLGLLERGWDVRIVAQKFIPQAWAAYPQLQNNPPARHRVHRAWPHRPHWLAALLFLPGLLFSLVTAPCTTLRYLHQGWARFGWNILRQFYLDLPLIRLGPNIIHFEFGSLAVGRTHLKELLDAKLSVSFRGYDLNYIGLDQPDYYSQVWKDINAAHFLGEDLWHRAQMRGAPLKLPHALISPAVNLAVIPKASATANEKVGTQDRPLRILSVGRLHWKKGYEYALRAVKALVDQGIHCEFRIIGEGERQAALDFARHQMGLTQEVEFLGGLPHTQVIEHLHWADVFLHAAVSEGFCNAVLEAQTMGLPVVCSDADGLRENVAESVTGFIVPRRDPAAMAKKLCLLATDGRLRQQMGQDGRVRVERHFQLEHLLDAFEDFYGKL
jgi:colanic acid/amylovoran biosynthesis glycosyltransferase